MSLNLHKDVNYHAWAVPMSGVDKTADQLQSYHQEGGTLLVFSVVLLSLEGQFRRLLVSDCHVVSGKALIKGSFQMSQSEPKRCSWYMEEGQELSMTCVARAAQRLLLQLMTATYGFQLGGTLKSTPPC